MDTVVNVAEQTKFYTDRTGVVGEREWLALQTQVVAYLTPKHLKDFIAAAETPTSVFVLVIILIQTTSFPHVLCSGVITQHAEVRLLLIVQLLKFTQLFAPNIQCTFVAIRKFSTPLNSCTRLWRKPGAFEISSVMISTVTCKTYDLTSIWGLSTVHGLVVSASAFVWRATALLTSSAAARPASSANIRATCVITAVESSQTVLLLVLLLKAGSKCFFTTGLTLLDSNTDWRSRLYWAAFATVLTETSLTPSERILSATLSYKLRTSAGRLLGQEARPKLSHSWQDLVRRRSG